MLDYTDNDYYFEYKKEVNCNNLHLQHYGRQKWELVSTFVLPNYKYKEGDETGNKHNVYFVFKRLVIKRTSSKDEKTNTEQ